MVEFVQGWSSGYLNFHIFSPKADLKFALWVLPLTLDPGNKLILSYPSFFYESDSEGFFPNFCCGRACWKKTAE